MSIFSKSTFVFGPELGARLKAVRERRGLSLRDVAVLMDRHGTGSHNQLSKLERGAVTHPSVNLLLDYLRACGAGPQDVAALFGPYLSLPPVPRTRSDAAVAKLLEVLPAPEQRAVLAWDQGITKAREERAADERGMVMVFAGLRRLSGHLSGTLTPPRRQNVEVGPFH
jgi:transcriptional regulator with XRE-family HTH domain